MIGKYFDEIMYESNNINAGFSELPFGVHDRLITRRQLYSINDDIIERLNNDLIIDLYMNLM